MHCEVLRPIELANVVIESVQKTKDESVEPFRDEKTLTHCGPLPPGIYGKNLWWQVFSNARKLQGCRGRYKQPNLEIEPKFSGGGGIHLRISTNDTILPKEPWTLKCFLGKIKAGLFRHE